MARTTVKVEVLKEYANLQLARTDIEIATPAFKAGICVMIEKVLMESDNYNGFKFIHEDKNNWYEDNFYTRIYS